MDCPWHFGIRKVSYIHSQVLPVHTRRRYKVTTRPTQSSGQFCRSTTQTPVLSHTEPAEHWRGTYSWWLSMRSAWVVVVSVDCQLADELPVQPRCSPSTSRRPFQIDPGRELPLNEWMHTVSNLFHARFVDFLHEADCGLAPFLTPCNNLSFLVRQKSGRN